MPGYMWPVITVVPSAGSIVDSMVSASAAIDLTKLASTGVVGSGCFEIVSATAVSVHNGAGLVVGHTAKLTTGAADEFQVLGTSAADSRALLGRFSADAVGPDLDFVKSRHATLGSNTIVQDNDVLGRLCWYPADGTNFATLAATFHVAVDDGTPAAGDIGCEFVWASMPGGGGAIRSVMSLSAAAVLNLPVVGSVISFGAADVLVTHSADALAFSGASSGYTFDASVGVTGNINATGGVIYNTGAATSFSIGSGAANKTSLAISTSADQSGYAELQCISVGGSTYGNIVLSRSGGNVVVGAAAPGATAAKTLALTNGATAPTTSEDLAHLYAADCAGAGTAALALYQEDGVRTAAAVASTNSIPCVFNGTTYYLLCTTVRS